MGRRPDKAQDFQKFYFDKVATGEGCGCAERIIDNHEFNRLAGTSRTVTGWLPRKGAWGRFLRKAGIFSRK
ncbi:hypothetical protein GV827_20070 [Sulfitobacter sp. JBTF-M27]|jgi:hypothetical protein|uniref:Uncharacterized protein n=1 Tax=Sulfitobacter sediminilitoris TaxID=2698830 RepID=A0A6P0CER8_9RHOB|nr:hypothetical protein [Sulfitobacter sediminilitoris]NEK24679.1 hypothetical protein [Sulfitobacter sediminilitoris]